MQAAGRRQSGSRMRENAYLRWDHVRFEVAGDGNQDIVRASEALPEETGSNRSPSPTSQAPSRDPATRLFLVSLLAQRVMRAVGLLQVF